MDLMKFIDKLLVPKQPARKVTPLAPLNSKNSGPDSWDPNDPSALDPNYVAPGRLTSPAPGDIVSPDQLGPIPASQQVPWNPNAATPNQFYYQDGKKYLVRNDVGPYVNQVQTIPGVDGKFVSRKYLDYNRPGIAAPDLPRIASSYAPR